MKRMTREESIDALMRAQAHTAPIERLFSYRRLLVKRDLKHPDGRDAQRLAIVDAEIDLRGRAAFGDDAAQRLARDAGISPDTAKVVLDECRKGAGQ